MTCPAAQHRRQGFTLLELMISMALVLILILGVNTVFSLTAQTVGAGNALGTIHRGNQAVAGTIYQDFRSMVVGNDLPCLVITNQRRYAFRSQADRDADKDGDPDTFDLNGDGVEDTTRETISNVTYNHRHHRMDKLTFFARGKFFRQTGTGTKYWEPDSTNSSIPQSSTEAWIKYGLLSLPNNATVPAPQTPGAGTPQSNPNNFFASQWILGRQVMLLVGESDPGQYQGTPTSTTPLLPIDPFATARGESGEVLQNNRYDVIQTTIAAYRQTVSGLSPDDSAGFRQKYWLLHGDFYFRGHPFADRPPSPASIARTLPVFLPGCTQFAVEYAGDFFTQDATGTVTSNRPDGVTDFTDASRKTRWYGLPRDVNGNGTIQNDVDVVPAQFVAAGGQKQPWERVVMPTTPPPGDPNRYICGWGADPATVNVPRPQMLRITITIDDPQGRLGGGESFEYVGNLQ